jgi:hypothetical protein
MITKVYIKEVNTVWVLEKQKPYILGSFDIITEMETESDYKHTKWFNDIMVEDVINRGKITINDIVYTFSHSEYFTNQEYPYRNIFLIAKKNTTSYPLSIESKEEINKTLRHLKDLLKNQAIRRESYYEKSLEDRMKYYRDEKEILETKLFKAKVWITTFMGVAVLLAILLLKGGGAA